MIGSAVVPISAARPIVPGITQLLVAAVVVASVGRSQRWRSAAALAAPCLQAFLLVATASPRSDRATTSRATRSPQGRARARCRLYFSSRGACACGAAPSWPHDREPCDDGTKDEREHSGRVNDRHEPAAAVFELDVSGRRDNSAASAALALLALARVGAAAGADPERTATGTTVTPSPSTGAPTQWQHLGEPDSLGEYGQQLVAAPARDGGRRRFGHAGLLSARFLSG